MTALIIGLTISAITGLTWLAYKYPKVYSKICPWLIGFIFISFIISVFWDTAISKSFETLIKYIEPEKLEEAKKAIQNVKILFVGSSLKLLGVYSVLLYLYLIKDLHLLIKKLNK